MKAIITEHQNGFKNYMVFESNSEKIYEVFNKIVNSIGFEFNFINSEEEFDELKDDLSKFELKIYQGKGIYDIEANFLGNSITDKEDGVKYYIDENYNQTESKIKYLDPMKIIAKTTMFN